MNSITILDQLFQSTNHLTQYDTISFTSDCALHVYN